MSTDPGLIHRAAPARVGEAPHPGLLLLHGRGADEADLLGLAPHLDPRFFVVTARAPFDWDIGYCWYDNATPEQMLRTFPRGLDLLRRLVGALADAYPIDPDRLYLLGFSQGSFMANAVTLSDPERIAGAVLLSGYQPPLDSLEVRAEAIRGKPFFVGHGTRDPLLGIQRGREVRDTLAGLDADVTFREYEMAHQILMEEIQDINAWFRARLDGEQRS
jgi:phospholipase/carboxylesterase